MTSFILVHGGSHGSWCWESVVSSLRSAGHDVDALDLPGRADPESIVTLEHWVEALAYAVDAARARSGERPTIVAHSMGGLTASQFAERRPEDVRQLIFVGAVVPLDGQSGLEAGGAAGDASVLMAPGGLVPSNDGKTFTIGPDVAAAAFYNRCEQSAAAAAIERLVPEHVAPLVTPLALGAGFASVSKRWIAGTDDRTVPLSLQREFAGRIDASIVEIDADHSPMISAPEELVRLLAAPTGMFGVPPHRGR